MYRILYDIINRFILYNCICTVTGISLDRFSLGNDIVNWSRLIPVTVHIINMYMLPYPLVIRSYDRLIVHLNIQTNLTSSNRSLKKFAPQWIFSLQVPGGGGVSHHHIFSSGELSMSVHLFFLLSGSWGGGESGIFRNAKYDRYYGWSSKIL